MHVFASFALIHYLRHCLAGFYDSMISDEGKTRSSVDRYVIRFYSSAIRACICPRCVLIAMPFHHILLLDACS